jgi:vacuolar-type H+-ATPase subunit H
MAPNEIKAVEMIRRIRDRHHELLKGKTPEERTALYEAKARAAMEKAKQLLQEQKAANGRTE